MSKKIEPKYLVVITVGALVVLWGIYKVLSVAFEAAVPIEAHTKGAENAKVEIVEYSDFQCPACAGQVDNIKMLLSEFDGDISFEYIHHPLPNHANAEIAARAAEAAGLQGKFWEMHDKLFEQQRIWIKQSRGAATGSFEDYAKELGLDLNKFKKDFGSKTVKNKINEDKQEGSKANIRWTPTFFINGDLIEENPGSYEEFKALIIKALNGDATSEEPEFMPLVETKPNIDSSTPFIESENAK